MHVTKVNATAYFEMQKHDFKNKTGSSVEIQPQISAATGDVRQGFMLKKFEAVVTYKDF